MTWLDPSRVAERLTRRSGLTLVGEFVQSNGGTFPAVRPKAPERPSGFGILMSRSPRSIQASFEPDRFARPLVTQIQDTFGASPSALEGALRSVMEGQDRLVVAVDGVRVTEVAELPTHPWQSFTVECERPLKRVTRDGPQVLDAAVEVAGVVLAVVLAGLPVEPVEDVLPDGEAGLPEGAVMRVTVNRYERSAANRMACIAHFGLSCQACGMDFEERYGELGADFITVHHRTPVSQMGEGYVVNPITDLVPVCPNCHAMLHRRDPPIAVEDLRSMISAVTDGPESP